MAKQLKKVIKKSVEKKENVQKKVSKNQSQNQSKKSTQKPAKKNDVSIMKAEQPKKGLVRQISLDKDILCPQHNQDTLNLPNMKRQSVMDLWNKFPPLDAKKNIFQIEYIRAKKCVDGKFFYLVQWHGYDDSYNTWEPENNIYDKSMITDLQKEEQDYADNQISLFKWQYYLESDMYGKKKGYNDYDANASQIVEKVFAEWRTNPVLDVTRVKSGEFEYHVDFNKMIQTNLTHPAHTQRKIMRTLIQ